MIIAVFLSAGFHKACPAFDSDGKICVHKWWITENNFVHEFGVT